MCLLMLAMPNATPSREQLLCACTNNPDGFGYAIHLGDRILTGKGLSAEHIVNKFLELKAQYPLSWGLFHARYATHGSVCVPNSHPYEVGGRQDIILAHNGVLGIDIKKGDDRSDTLVFAEDWLPNMLDLLDDEQGFSELEELVSGSKIAIFSTASELSKQIYLLNEDLGHWENGLWWSNYSYMTKINSYSGYYSQMDNGWDYVDDDLKLLCLVCQDYSEHEVFDSICASCYHCIDCQEDFNVCLCWKPEHQNEYYQDYMIGGEYER